MLLIFLFVYLWVSEEGFNSSVGCYFLPTGSCLCIFKQANDGPYIIRLQRRAVCTISRANAA